MFMMTKLQISETLTKGANGVPFMASDCTVYRQQRTLLSKPEKDSEREITPEDPLIK